MPHSLIPQIVNPLFTPVVTGIFTLTGVCLGSFLNQQSSYRFAHRQKMHELRIQTYADLMGLKIPFIQACLTNVEAKILCEFYETRFYITGISTDHDAAKKENERALKQISEISLLRKEICKCIGEMKIAYPQSKELSSLIEAVYTMEAISISEINGKISDIDALVKWKQGAVADLQQLLNTEYRNKIEALLQFVYPLIEKA